MIPINNNFIIKNFFYFYFFYKKFNISINLINICNYNKFLNIFYKNFNIFILNNALDFKYVWSKTYLLKNNNDLILNFFKNNNINSNKYIIKSFKHFNSNNIIIFKKKTSVFKKVFDIDYAVLNKINEYKLNSNANIFKNYNLSKNLNEFINYSVNISIKNIDLKKKIKLLFNVNRKIVKKLFNIKKIKQHAITKKIKHICNLKKKDSFIKLENSLVNIIMHSDFFFSINDCIWFVKNGFVFLNSCRINNENELLKPYDIINISNNSFYYNYYKNFLNYLIINSYKLGNKLWLITKNRKEAIYFRGEKNIVRSESYSKFFENYKFFKKDIPSYLEVDYICMTIILLYYNKNSKLFSYYNLKFFNFYLNRLYNWKFVI